MNYLKKEGTYDLYDKYNDIWKYVINKIFNVVENYNCSFIRTPTFEDTKLYKDLIGKNTDVVSKELYSFIDKNKDSISLRPEGTSGIIRSFLENKLYLDNKNHKLYYYGSMFRQEKIEKGRFREFQQFGVEYLNNNSYLCDVEIICLAVNIFKNLGLNDIVVHINNLGSYNDKNNYEKALKQYFKDYLNCLCDECKKRFKNNPIRILDCKIDKRSDIVLNAPKIEDYVKLKSKTNFNLILKKLDKLNINYFVNKNLVRGLNYYTDTVFEIKTNIDGLGSSNTICGGGRYNGIIKTDDNINIAGIGFAIGIERLIYFLYKNNLLYNVEKVIDINILFFDFELCIGLRNLGYCCECNYDRKSRFLIDKLNEKYLLVNNDTNDKNILDKDDLIQKIASIID